MALSAATSSMAKVCSVCGASYPDGTAHQCAMSGPQPFEEDNLLGVVLGERYRIVSCLSRGGMGVVYKAQHTVLDKPLAIKVMLQTQDEAARQRFMQEAKLASSVQHPNIVDIIDFGVLPSQKPYLVMELLVGQTLADAIFMGPLSPARTCHIAAQVARGLHAVHQKGIIHRDLKPAKVTSVETGHRPVRKPTQIIRTNSPAPARRLLLGEGTQPPGNLEGIHLEFQAGKRFQTIFDALRTEHLDLPNS